MYCRNYTGTVRSVLCREVYYTESLFRRVNCMYDDERDFI